MNRYITTSDRNEFLHFLLTFEKNLYKENPLPTIEDNNRKVQSYRKKVEEITASIAKREGIILED